MEISYILKQEINENKLNLILKNAIKAEIEEAINSILKSSKNLPNDKSFKNIHEVLTSKVNRIYLIVSFLKK